MSKVKQLGSTTIVSHPSWTGRGFAEAEPACGLTVR